MNSIFCLKLMFIIIKKVPKLRSIDFWHKISKGSCEILKDNHILSLLALAAFSFTGFKVGYKIYPIHVSFGSRAKVFYNRCFIYLLNVLTCLFNLVFLLIYLNYDISLTCYEIACILCVFSMFIKLTYMKNRSMT